MSIIKKVLKITNIKVDELLKKNTNKSSKTQLLKNDDFMSLYKDSNDRIKKTRQSIQNIKQ